MTRKIKNNLLKYIAVFILACFSFSLFAYSVEDCEAQKIAIYNDLNNLNLINSYSYSDARYIITVVNSTRHNLGNLSSNLSSADRQTITAVEGNLQTISDTALLISNRLFSTFSDMQVISNRVSSIDCTSCTLENGGLGCCDVISNIWLSVSNIHFNTDISLFMLQSVTNDLNSVVSLLSANTNLLSSLISSLNDNIYITGEIGTYIDYFLLYKNIDSFQVLPWQSVIGADYTLMTFMYANMMNLSEGIPSINNYLYKYIYDEFPPFSYHMTSNLITLTRESTNFFSFFVSSTTARPVLSDYNDLDFPSYHAYLTNFYINVAEGNTANFTAIQRANTNWFGRIETLIASLVFADTKTNPVDDNSSVYEDMAQEFNDNSTQYKDDLIGLVDSPVGVTRSAVSSLRSLSQAFTDASIPEEVNLVSIPLPDGTQDIKFNPSGSGASAFRCVSTVVWVFTALFLVVQFIWFSFRAISHIVIFIWDVLSMIFGGGT